MGWLDNWKEGENKSYYEQWSESRPKAEQWDISPADTTITFSVACHRRMQKDENLSARCMAYADLLSDEIWKRSFCRLRVVPLEVSPRGMQPSSASDSNSIRPSGAHKLSSIVIDCVPPRNSSSHFAEVDEGYEMHLSTKDSTITLTSFSQRGCLFSVGRFLRECVLGFEQGYQGKYRSELACFWLPKSMKLFNEQSYVLKSKPDCPMRQHQIAYRPKTNSYDAFTVQGMREEILAMALFGMNSVEVIPPGLDDAAHSPHFEEHWLDMLWQVSSICHKYDLMVSIWYPAFFKDYFSNIKEMDSWGYGKNEGKIYQEVVDHWHLIFRHLRRLDHLFVPGGDPGGHAPRELFHIVTHQADVCKKQFHPDACVWISTQFGLAKSVDLDEPGWNPREREEEFFAELTEYQSVLKDLVTGIVYGPWSAYTIKDYRAKIPPCFRLRTYPDLCHCTGCQFPVQTWDAAFSVMHSREPITIRPRFFWDIIGFHLNICDSMGCYSEGINDDVNKVVCLLRAWGDDEILNENVVDTLQIGLEQYARILCGIWVPDLAVVLVDVLFCLEKNWMGSLRNPSFLSFCQDTYFKFQPLQDFLFKNPKYLHNWRICLIKLRTMYDEFVRQRFLLATRRAMQDALGDPMDSYLKKPDLTLSELPQHTETATKKKKRLLRTSSGAPSSATSMMMAAPGSPSSSFVGGGGASTSSTTAVFLAANAVVPTTRTRLSQSTGKSDGRSQDEQMQDEVLMDYLGPFFEPAQQDEQEEQVNKNNYSSPVVINQSQLPTNISALGLRRRAERVDNHESLYSELVGLSYLLFIRVGYQSSVGFGGQHRQRGAFLDHAWTKIAHPEFAFWKRAGKYVPLGSASGMRAAKKCVAIRLSEEEKVKKVLCYTSVGDYVQQGKSRDMLFAADKHRNDPIKLKYMGDVDHPDQCFDGVVFETVASDHDVLRKTEIVETSRSWQRWATLIWPTARMLFELRMEQDIMEQVDSAKSSTISITYVGSIPIVPGGDWEELGRDCLPTKCVVRCCETDDILHTIHELQAPLKETKVFEYPFPLKLLAEKRKLVLEFLPEKASDISFISVVMPVAEIGITVENAVAAKL